MKSAFHPLLVRRSQQNKGIMACFPLDNPPYGVLFCICSLQVRLLAIIIDK